MRGIGTLGEVARHVGVVLLDQCGRAGGELAPVFVCPPVDEMAVAVVLGALIVEAVADLVADHRADTPVVGGVVGVGVEERWLQDRRREDDLVHPRVVVGVDRLRCHEPFVTVHRTAEFGRLAVETDFGSANHVAVQIISGNDECGVIAPAFGVADLGGEFVQLRQRSLPGRGGHPLQVGDADPVGLAQVRDQGVHPRLGLRRKVVLNVEATDGVTHYGLDQGDRPLPSLADLLGAAEGAAVEGEVLVDQGAGENRRAGMDQPPARPVLPVGNCLARPRPGERGQVIRLTNDEFADRVGGDP